MEIRNPVLLTATLVAVLASNHSAHAAYVFTRVIDATSGYSAFMTGGMTDAGVIVFTANMPGGGNGVFTTDGSTITTIVDSSGPFASFDIASINAGGSVVV